MLNIPFSSSSSNGGYSRTNMMGHSGSVDRFKYCLQLPPDTRYKKSSLKQTSIIFGSCFPGMNSSRLGGIFIDFELNPDSETSVVALALALALGTAPAALAEACRVSDGEAKEELTCRHLSALRISGHRNQGHCFGVNDEE
jgi:hypothetical protein